VTGAASSFPSDTNTRRIIDVLKRGEEVEFGFLGVTLPRSPDDEMPRNVSLESVILGMPAAEAGLQPGDRIVRINDHTVKKPADLFLHIAMGLAGPRYRSR